MTIVMNFLNIETTVLTIKEISFPQALHLVYGLPPFSYLFQ